jgi:Peptidase family S41
VRFARTAALLGVATTLLAGGCVVEPDLELEADRRQLATAALRRIASDRDQHPHDNPTVASLDPVWMDRYATADEPEERRRAMVRLLDQLNDGHLDYSGLPTPIQSPLAFMNRVDGRLLIEFHPKQAIDADYSGLTDKGRIVGELLSIDGYRPNTWNAAEGLLRSSSSEPVMIEVRQIGSADAVRIALRRSLIGVIRRADPVITPPANATVLARSASHPNEIFAARLDDSPSIGLVRFGFMSPPRKADDNDPDLGCALHRSPCELATSMIDAVHAVSDCDWIIVDLQGSSGGTCAHAAAICAALLPPSVETMPFGHAKRPLLGGLLGADAWKWSRSARTSSRTRFVVMIDDDTISASEHIAGVLRAVPSTQFVGTRSAGAEYSLAKLKLPGGGTLIFGSNPGVWRDLPLVEGRGISPTIDVGHDKAIIAREGIAVAIARMRRNSLAAALEYIRRTDDAERDAASAAPDSSR